MPLIKNLFSLIKIVFCFYFFHKKQIIHYAVIAKENECLKRTLESHGISQPYNIQDKRFLRFMALLSKEATRFIQFVSPHTVLYTWKTYCHSKWNRKKRKPGRPPVSKKIKELILSMKIHHYNWGNQRISDELKKIDISICKKTIAKVIQNGRKRGLVLPNGSWEKFLTSHIKSLFACDFFTVDIFGFRRFYVFFIIKIENRKIVHWNITQNPNIAFLRRQISHFEEQYPESILIHDNSGEFKWFPYEEYDIKDLAITPYSPNMNAFAERFIRSIRRECLDWFIILHEKQLRNIIKEYMHYYNFFRPHQGIGRIPEGKPPDRMGKIKKQSVLFGLHHHYYRSA